MYEVELLQGNGTPPRLKKINPRLKSMQTISRHPREGAQARNHNNNPKRAARARSEPDPHLNDPILHCPCPQMIERARQENGVACLARRSLAVIAARVFPTSAFAVALCKTRWHPHNRLRCFFKTSLSESKMRPNQICHCCASQVVWLAAGRDIFRYTYIHTHTYRHTYVFVRVCVYQTYL